MSAAHSYLASTFAATGMSIYLYGVASEIGAS